MNNLISITNPLILTMSSREIADLVEKRHDNVKRTIEALVKQGVISDPQFEDGNKSANGIIEKLYKIGKRDCFVIVAQLSPEFTARVVDRWQELEAQPTIDPMKALSDPATMRGLLLTYTEKVLELEHQVEELTPKAEALDRIAGQKEGSVCLRIAAKLLQMPEKQFLQFANTKGFIFRNHFSRIWQGYSEKAKAGLVELKLTTIERDDGSIKTVEQVLITRSGIAKLAELMERERV